jgi:hypothetical protein
LYVDVLDDWFYDGKMRLERSSYFIFGNIKMVGFGNWRLRWEVCRGIDGEKIGEMELMAAFYISERVIAPIGTASFFVAAAAKRRP